jgi:uncharacterized phage infection (PIP) family protein YhgE
LLPYSFLLLNLSRCANEHGDKDKRDILIMQEKKKEISLIKRNILKYAEYKGISKYEIYQKTGISRSVLSQSNGMTEDNLLKFLAYYSDVNPNWLLTSEGEMLKSDVEHICNNVEEVTKEDPAASFYICDKLLERNEQLARENGQLKEKNKQLETEIELLKHENRRLNDNIKELNGKNKEFKKQSGNSRSYLDIDDLPSSMVADPAENYT